MNLTHTLLLLLFCIGNTVFAQDKIYERNGNIINAKVLKITNQDIEYRKATDANRIVYIISKKEVTVIKYESGETEIMNNETQVETVAEANEAEEVKQIGYGNQMFSVNVLSPVFEHIAIAYEVFSKRGYTSLKIPITINYIHKAPYIGLELKLFPTAQGMLRGFIAPSLAGGSQPVQTISTSYYYSQATGYSNQKFIAALIKAGVSLQVTKGFNVTIDAGIGHVRFANKNIITKSAYVYDAGVHLGYRF